MEDKETENPKRLRPKWMKGVEGFWVFGKEHEENEKHSREKPTKELTRFKEKCPTALLTVEDLTEVQKMTEELAHDETKSSQDE